MTYQSASGAGAQNMREMLEQMGALHQSRGAAAARSRGGHSRHRSGGHSRALGGADFPTAHFGAPLAASLIPWIDKDLGNGQSREEWKAGAESNKIMGTEAAPGAGGGHLRAGERDALPLAGAHHQAEAAISRCARSKR